MKYTININFRHWKKGSILERYEYNRLPENAKSQCTEVIVKKTLPVVKATTSTPLTTKKPAVPDGDSRSEV